MDELDPADDELSGDDLSADGREVWDAMRAVYRGFLEGDSAAADLHLHPDVTIWDSAEPGLVRGLDQLQVLRSRRPPPGSGVTVAAIDATDPVVDVWGDTALLRHLLVVRFAGGEPPERVRNTSVWRRTGGRWLAVHNHEDVLAGDGGSTA